MLCCLLVFFFQAEDGRRYYDVTGVQTCALPISLAVSQVIHGPDEIMLIKHTDCALIRYGEDELRAMLTAATGIEPTISWGTFHDLDENTRSDMRKIRESPLLVNKENVRGFVLDVGSCLLREVI